jgi:hypothetical protein
MDNIGIVNSSWKKQEGIEYINIMRGSVLGNPFKMLINTPAERKRVIEEYRQYLWHKLNEKDNPVKAEIMILASKTKPFRLVCCCKPDDCHGDVIVNCINWLRNNHKVFRID